MADEEVDWDDLDEWRGGEGSLVAKDEDVLSLAGAEGEVEGETAEDQAKEKSPRKAENKPPTGPPRAPPTGPRRSLARNPNQVEPPTGPPPISDKGQDKIEDDDLPEGWTKVMSNTHKIPFYYHKTTKTTVWVKPTADTLTEDRPPSPPAPPPNDTQVKEQNQVTTVEKTESSPVTPANVDEVASAYANRKVVQSAQGQNGEQAMRPPPPTGPSNWRPDERRRARSRSPGRDSVKRPRGNRDEGNDMIRNDRNGRVDSPPLSARFTEKQRFNEMRSQTQSTYRRVSRPASPPNLPPSATNPKFSTGYNNAPKSISRWGPQITPAPHRAPYIDSRPPAPPVTQTNEAKESKEDAPRNPLPLAQRISKGPITTTQEDALSTREKLREEARKAEETLKRIKEEQERLEREEAAKRAQTEPKRAAQVAQNGRESERSTYPPRFSQDRGGERFSDRDKDFRDRERPPPRDLQPTANTRTVHSAGYDSYRPAHPPSPVKRTREELFGPPTYTRHDQPRPRRMTPPPIRRSPPPVRRPDDFVARPMAAPPSLAERIRPRDLTDDRRLIDRVAEPMGGYPMSERDRELDRDRGRVTIHAERMSMDREPERKIELDRRTSYERPTIHAERMSVGVERPVDTNIRDRETVPPVIRMSLDSDRPRGFLSREREMERVGDRPSIHAERMSVDLPSRDNTSMDRNGDRGSRGPVDRPRERPGMSVDRERDMTFRERERRDRDVGREDDFHRPASYQRERWRP
ncbi:hypothetical protein M231_07383 [Tremella mesenterica]|uniref:WW domain-containing protein n=1 Tax=Tremella mesenterica TaxID=5217 RepID=A0A4Q1BFP3_TREME|nr:hypothetical protein M231_07383 [Tremella mesenterica]